MLHEHIHHLIPEFPLSIPQGSRVYTPESDLRAVIYLSQIAPALLPIIEVGCNDGVTTRNLALYNVRKTVFGYDTGTPGRHQATERPAAIGVHCRGLPNVKIVHGPVTEHACSRMVGFAFIDGDHTLEGVKADAEFIIPRMYPGGIVAFHDYIDASTRHSKSCVHDWLKVGDYLESLADRAITHIRGTSVAYFVA